MTFGFNELPIPYHSKSVAFVQLASKFGSEYHLLNSRENIINTDIPNQIKYINLNLNIFSSTESWSLWVNWWLELTLDIYYSDPKCSPVLPCCWFLRPAGAWGRVMSWAELDNSNKLPAAWRWPSVQCTPLSPHWHFRITPCSGEARVTSSGYHYGHVLLKMKNEKTERLVENKSRPFLIFLGEAHNLTSLS